MFDFWLIISNFIELFLGGWRGGLMKTILLFKRQAVSHKTIPSCLKIEIKSKVLNVASWDFTGPVEANIIEDIYNYLEGFCIQPNFSTPCQNSKDHHQLIRGKRFCWQTLKSPQLNLFNQQEHIFSPMNFQKKFSVLIHCDTLLCLALVSWLNLLNSS